MSVVLFLLLEFNGSPPPPHMITLWVIQNWNWKLSFKIGGDFSRHGPNRLRWINRFCQIFGLWNLSLRLSFDCQTTENVIEHRLLGSLSTTNFDGKPKLNRYAKLFKNKITSSFATATYYDYWYQKNLLQRSHKTSHRLLWVCCGEVR